MRLFDAYLFVDWSARGVPGPVRETADSLWVGEGVAHGTGPVEPRETYHRTRADCYSHARQRLLSHAALGRRVLIGFDFPYGYPTGYAEALGFSGDSLAWRRVWTEIAGAVRDDSLNANNRYEAASDLNARCGEGPGPLWGCHQGYETATLRMKSPGFPYTVRPGLELARLRHADRRATGVQEVSKLAGVGSVGSQALLGIPYLLRLRDDPELRRCSRLWPFETGFTGEPSTGAGPYILHAEIWPGTVRGHVDAGEPIRDRAQVRALVEWAAEADAAGQLAACFERPAGLSSAQEDEAVTAEGWILGA